MSDGIELLAGFNALCS